MEPRQLLNRTAYWDVAAEINDSNCESLLKAASAIDSWFGTSRQWKTRPVALLSKFLGGIQWKPSPPIWNKLGFHHVEFSTVFVNPTSLPFETAIHEFGHVMDNSLGSHPLSSIFGGGPSDDLARYIGIEPEIFFPRFHAANYDKVMQELNLELNPSDYGRKNGPAEDFSESFRLTVTDPEYFAAAAPIRFAWFENWKLSLVNKFEG